MFATFGLFTNGFEKFDKAYEEGLFDRVFTTNLIYQKPEMLEKKWYCSVGVSRYVAAIIDRMNKGEPMADLVRPAAKIKDFIELYKK